MKEVPAPKAVNIIRPLSVNQHEKSSKPTPTVSQSDYHLLSKRRSSKIINSQIHEPQKSKRNNTFHLYDPKQPQQQLMQQKPQPLKRPVIKLYRPAKYQSIQPPPQPIQRSQTKQQLINLHLSREKQVINISNIPNHQHSIIENPVVPENASEQISDSDDQDVPQLLTDDEEQEEGDDSDDEDDMLTEARINRKIADLEISNKSLLTINEMLESTVRHQAKQVASFKKLAMTVPNEEEQRRHEEQLEIIRRAENEDDWQNDEQFNRLRRMTEHLIEEAQRALTHQVETGGRVISSHHHHHHRRSSTRSNSRIHYNSSNNLHEQ